MDVRLWRSPVGATSRRANEPKVPRPIDEVTLWQHERSCGAINQPEPWSIRHSLIRQSDCGRRPSDTSVRTVTRVLLLGRDSLAPHLFRWTQDPRTNKRGVLRDLEVLVRSLGAGTRQSSLPAQ